MPKRPKKPSIVSRIKDDDDSAARTKALREANEPTVAPRRKKKAASSSKRDRDALMGYFPKLAKRNFLAIRAKPSEHGKTQQDLMFEAFNLLFAKHGLPEMTLDEDDDPLSADE